MHVCGECGQRYEREGFCTRDGSPLAVSDDELLGLELGRYRIARLLGEGGMGRVYVAVQPSIGSRVAIKVLSEQCARNPELVERFFAEARAVNLIRHESIVNVLDMALMPNGRPYIVMELIDGDTLARLIRLAPAPLGGVVHAMTEVLSALDAAHAIGIVHRDLKPDNILITGNGHAKVLDFGIAKLAPSLAENASPRTRTGALLGTPAYMAPEQISGGTLVDARTDIYAAGVVTFEAMTGQRPFRGDTMFDLMRAHMDEAPPSPCTLRPEMPAAIEHVILTALAKRADDRFQTADAMATALQHAARDLAPEQWQLLSRRPSSGLLTPPPSGPRRMIPPSRNAPTRPAPAEERKPTPPAFSVVARRRRPVVIGIAAVAVAGGIAALALGLRGSGGDTVAVVENGSNAPGAPSPSPGVANPSGAANPLPGVPNPSGVPSPSPGAPGKNEAVRGPSSNPSPSRGNDDVALGRSPNRRAPNRAQPTQTAPDRPRALHPGRADGPAEPDDVTASGAPIATQVGKDEPKHLVIKPPFDPRRFDVFKFLPHARALARQLLDDAELTELTVAPVASDGTIDLTHADGSHETFFVFRSERASKEGRGACVVKVTATAKRVEAALDDRAFCYQKLATPPPCRLSRLWDQARTHGPISDTPAMMSFAANGWTFWHENLTWTIGDCP